MDLEVPGVIRSLFLKLFRLVRYTLAFTLVIVYTQRVSLTSEAYSGSNLSGLQGLERVFLVVFGAYSNCYGGSLECSM